MFDVLVICGFGNKKELGTGHLIRSLNIVNYLKKKNKLKHLGFIVNRSNDNSKVKKIIEHFDKNIKVFFLKSNYLINEVKNFNSKLLIVDSLSKLKNLEIKKLKKKNKKIILFDDNNHNSIGYDLKINPLIWSKKIKNKKNLSGYRFNIVPSYFQKFKIKKNTKKVFIFFGGFDNKNYTSKLSKILSKENLKQFKFFFDIKYKNEIPKNSNFRFYNKSNFYRHFYDSNTVFCSGGLVMFDSIYLKKNTYCKSQFEHQSKNINKLIKLKLVKRLKINQIRENLQNKEKFKKQNIITNKNINFALKNINNIYISAKNEY